MHFVAFMYQPAVSSITFALLQGFPEANIYDFHHFFVETCLIVIDPHIHRIGC